MKTCASCGTENPDIARFCLACGSQLADAPAPQETRKVVTIVFSDLKGSTSLGEALDSEALREVMTRYFDAMRSELERHGGVIEKFIGDAVMAVFGLPRLHEDDALRAVRAAAGMQNALEELNVELQRHYGVQLANRTGVNTGEVVSGDPSTGQRLVTGDAVNVAARLEQAAGEKEVLLGELTYRLVRDSVEVQEVEPLTLKGKAEPVPAYQLVRVTEDGDVEIRRDAPLIGRTNELAALEAVFEDAVATRSARLATLVADAGVGKSRLTAELLERISSRAFMLRGRCLPYGDGITFWPLAEALKNASGVVNDDGAEEALEKLSSLTGPAGPEVTERIAAMIGVRHEPFPMEELAWGMRRLLEHLAADRPVVLVVEDVHWAEETLLELIEQLVRAIDAAPVLVLCPARPTLVDEHPEWGTGERATRIELEPLDADASRSMVESMLGGGSLDPEVLDRVVIAAEGNPLFAEQLVRMLVDEGVLERSNGAWRASGPLSDLHVPPTIQALLAARLDTLASDGRAVIEPASVVGYVFADAAVSALTPPEVSPRVRTELTTLAQKHLVTSVEDDEEHHRFQHIMIRDTAYDGILKRARADLHERFVVWADDVNRDRAAEFEEILGYHLEQAWTYLSELGPLDDRGRAIGEDGACRLASAGRRAFARGDVPAAESLLGRAAALLPADHPDRLRLLPEHGETLLLTGRYDEASAVLGEAIDRAESAPAAAARASLVRLLVRLRTGQSDEWVRETVDQEIDAAIGVFEKEGDEAGLAMACRLLAWSAGAVCRFGDAAEASERAVEHARRAGDVRQERRAATAYAGAASLGPTNVDEAIARCEACLEQTAGNRQSEGNILAVLGGLYAMQGAFDHARTLVVRARALLEELGLEMDAARVGLEGWRVEMLAGDLDAAERELRSSYDALDAVGERWLLPTVAGHLAQTLLAQGAPLEEVESLTDRARTLAADVDVASQALWRGTLARTLARRASYGEAEELIREALDLLAPTDATMYQLDAYLDLGEVLSATGRTSEAREAYLAARALAELKGGVVALSAVLRRLEALDAAPA